MVESCRFEPRFGQSPPPFLSPVSGLRPQCLALQVGRQAGISRASGVHTKESRQRTKRRKKYTSVNTASTYACVSGCMCSYRDRDEHYLVSQDRELNTDVSIIRLSNFIIGLVIIVLIITGTALRNHDLSADRGLAKIRCAKKPDPRFVSLHPSFRFVVTIMPLLSLLFLLLILPMPIMTVTNIIIIVVVIINIFIVTCSGRRAEHQHPKYYDTGQSLLHRSLLWQRRRRAVLPLVSNPAR